MTLSAVSFSRGYHHFVICSKVLYFDPGAVAEPCSGHIKKSKSKVLHAAGEQLRHFLQEPSLCKATRSPPSRSRTQKYMIRVTGPSDIACKV